MRETPWRQFLRRTNSPASRTVARFGGEGPGQSRFIIRQHYQRGVLTEAEYLRLIERVDALKDDYTGERPYAWFFDMPDGHGWVGSRDGGRQRQKMIAAGP